MKKTKYIYNPKTLRYEQHAIPIVVKMARVFAFVCACIVTAFLITWVTNVLFPPKINEQIAAQNTQLKNKYAILNEELQQVKTTLADIEKRDNNIYRSILEAAPIADSMRQQQATATQAKVLNTALSQAQLVANTQANILLIKNRLAAQQQSFTQIEKLLANKADYIAHLPAIQPVSNKDLSRIASGFGLRIDPVYKTVRMHKGLDFTAPQGTPIYATANGTVTKAEYNPTGYGNYVVINHGYGYETLYGHMVKVNCTPGTQVVRGQLIGWIGTTGKSTGPHCHYEVHKNGEAIDPIFYFYNDLTVEQFDKLVKLAQASNQSID